MSAVGDDGPPGGGSGGEGKGHEASFRAKTRQRHIMRHKRHTDALFRAALKQTHDSLWGPSIRSVVIIFGFGFGILDITFVNPRSWPHVFVLSLMGVFTYSWVDAFIARQNVDASLKTLSSYIRDLFCALVLGIIRTVSRVFTQSTTSHVTWAFFVLLFLMAFQYVQDRYASKAAADAVWPNDSVR